MRVRHRLPEDTVLPAGQRAAEALAHELFEPAFRSLELGVELRRQRREVLEVLSRDQQQMGVVSRCMVGDDVELDALVEKRLLRALSVAEGTGDANLRRVQVGHASILSRAHTQETFAG